MKSGIGLDLPTEAQWEYACRAGTTTLYSHGERADSDYIWYALNASSETHSVGMRKPNPWGLYDVHGNVWEWCRDFWNDTTGRVIRGGGWTASFDWCTSFSRDYYTSSNWNNHTGFRLVVE